MTTFSVLNEKEKKLEQLIDDYGDGLLRMCCLYLNDLQLAQDAVQETFIKVYNSLDKFRGDSSEKTWITSIAINVCKSYLRKNRYKHMLFFDDLHGEPQTEDKISDDEVLKRISELKPKYREVILLYYYRELKIKEIAEVLKISESAAAVRLSRAREQLKNSLKEWYFDG